MRPRPLSSSQRWDLGLLLAMLLVFCLVLTALVNLRAVPLLYAAKPTPAAPVALPSPRLLPTLELLPEAPPQLPAFSTISLAPPAMPAPRTADIRYYNGKKYRFVKTLHLRVTAYAPDSRCCFPYDGTTTASGVPVTTNGGNLAAADTSLIPMHSLVIVPGYARNAPVPVLDRGSAIKGHRLDVLLPTYDKAKSWGVRYLAVKIYEPAPH
jgi:3D (Asp-Asp-Asp) domain-containing protein